jgi:predicted lipoprotein with Yx(FWY)xxD motif
MPLPFRPIARPIAALAIAALILGLAAVALRSTPAAHAATSSCKDPITSAPTGPATVSAKSSKYGKVLAVGSGAYAGCSLYLLTSDQLHAIDGSDFGCSNHQNPIAPCDTVLWPALLTNGAPIAGPGVNPTLLGTVSRNDLPGLGTVQQVTYAGMPLYRFFLDEETDETEGANLFDPVTDPAGTWYLVDPSRGHPATGTAEIDVEHAPLNGVGPDQTVLGARMDNDFSLTHSVPFPVYTMTADTHKSACQGACATVWQPVLTSGPPAAGPGVDQHALGIIVRPDGTHQVTYDGQPLYQFLGDAYISALGGTPSINGVGAGSPFGVFNTITP